MQRLNLQILEKRSQKVDGEVGQDYWQNAKALVTKEKMQNKKKLLIFQARHFFLN